MTQDTPEPLVDIIDKCRRDVAQAEKAITESRSLSQEMLADLAGPLQSKMTQSLDFTKECLHSSDSKVRMAAILILRDHWKPNDFLTVCETVLQDDPAEQVRNIAVISLGKFASGTNDLMVGRKLAAIVRDSLLSDRLRVFAYKGLFQLRGLPVESWPGVRGDFTFPNEVDWSMVDSYFDLPS